LLARRRHVGALLLAGVQGFFLRLSSCREKKRCTDTRVVAMLRSASTAQNSASVRSGFSSTRARSAATWSSNGETLPPVGLAATSPVLCQRCTQRIAELALTLKCVAAACRDWPPATAAITRSRKSCE
jgi:hypothetical protein